MCNEDKVVTLKKRQELPSVEEVLKLGWRSWAADILKKYGPETKHEEELLTTSRTVRVDIRCNGLMWCGSSIKDPVRTFTTKRAGFTKRDLMDRARRAHHAAVTCDHHWIEDLTHVEGNLYSAHFGS